LRAQTITQGSITGVVVAGDSYRAFVDAQISLSALGASTRTNRKGSFTFSAVAVGDHELTVRVVGYAPFRSTVSVRSGEETTLPIVLPKLSALDTVVVAASTLPYTFVENRAVGLGHFVSGEALRAEGVRPLGGVLATIPGLGVVQGKGGRAFVLSKRRAVSINRRAGESGSQLYNPDAAERAQGVIVACYARVYLNEQLLNPSSPADPVNINEFLARDIEAIEYYAGPSQTPARYSRLNSDCGIVVLHMRR
jgi:hypothetical protein